MKKLIFSLFLFLSFSSLVHAQWATSGTVTSTTNSVGIGTTTPISKLDVNGAISIKGINVNDYSPIGVATDGTYVIASGSRIKGTYTLTFEAANRVQTVELHVSANQYDGASSVSVLSNTSYGGNTIMSNFRTLFSADMSTVYLVSDVANWGGTLPTSTTPMGFYPLGVNGGNVGIGTLTPKETLSVNGNIRAKQVKVESANWPDYVFKKEYQLPSLQEVKAYIDQNQHLPEIPSEQQIAKEGLNLGEMNKLLMKKVEELTLYMIEMKEDIKDLQKQNKDLKKQIK
jgi:hypothetical protein